MRKLIIIVLMLLIPSNCFAVDYVQDANCQAAYLNDANVDPIVDSSQNTNTGTAIGNPVWSNAAPAAGYSGGYWTYDVVDDSHEIAHHASLDVGINADFSIVAWIYLTSYGDGDYGRIFDKLDTAGNDSGYSFYVSDNADADRLVLNLGDNTAGSDVHNSANEVLSTGSWIHVALVYDDTAAIAYFYADGVATTDSTVGSFGAAGSGNVATIADRLDNARQFDGRIDELAFFDRTLSQAEITDIINNGLGSAASGSGGAASSTGETSEVFWID